MKTDINKIMVFDYFAGNLTPLQRKKIENWLQSPQNEELFYLYLEEWENNNSEYEPDGDVALKQYVNILNTEEKEFSPSYVAKDKKEKYRLIGEKKESTKEEDLCSGMSKEFVVFLKYV